MTSSIRLQPISSATRRLFVPSTGYSLLTRPITSRIAPSTTFSRRPYSSSAKQPSNMGSVTDIKSKAQFDELVAKNPYVAVQAHATWCGPCKAISPIFEKHAEALARPGSLAFARFDTDEVPDLAFEFGIRSIPAFFFFEKGEKADSLTGAAPPALEKAVKSLAEKATS